MMARPRPADDFKAIRALILELQLERAQAARDNALDRTDEVYRRSSEPVGKSESGPLPSPHRR